MINKVTLSVLTTVDTPLPVGVTAVASIKYDMLDVTGMPAYTNDTGIFDDVADGTYSGRITALDMNGVAMAEPAETTEPIVVPKPVIIPAPTTFAAPATIGVLIESV